MAAGPCAAASKRTATADAGTARFFHNGRPIGDIADPGFARAFFSIWLDPRTSRAEHFRRKLLGE